ncbi:MAG: 50S ribosomal protein L24 [bacterium]
MERKKNKQKKLHIRKGDTVMVIAGENKGSKGRVLEVYNEAGRAIVEGVNIVTKHKKSNAQNQPGSITKEEAPVNISNLMIVDGQGNTTRIGRRLNDDGKLVRYSKKSGEEIKDNN